MPEKPQKRTLAELKEFNTKLRLQREVIAQNAAAMTDAKEQAKATTQTYAEAQTKLGEIVDEFNRVLPLFDDDKTDK